jgi:hypothetical protein
MACLRIRSLLRPWISLASSFVSLSLSLSYLSLSGFHDLCACENSFTLARNMSICLRKQNLYQVAVCTCGYPSMCDLMQVFAVFAVALILLREQNLDEAVVSNDGRLYGPILNVQRSRTRPCTPQPGLDR